MSTGTHDALEALWEDLKSHLETERHPCLVCGSTELDFWAKENYLEALRCPSCGMISVNPHFTDEGLDLFYSTYFKIRQEENLLKQQRDITYLIDRDWISRIVSEGRILDVGCSGGFFLSKFDPSRYDRQGVEIAQDAADHALKNFNVPVTVGGVHDLPDEPFDLIMMRGVVEHFRDPRPVLKRCSELLKPGGRLFFTATPCGEAFAFDVYRHKWRLFTPLEHIHFFSVSNLSQLLKPMSLELEDFHYQYEETPYADPLKDFAKIRSDIVSIANGKDDEVGLSCPFPGSMMTAVWKKTS